MKIEYISRDEFELSYRAEIYEESESLIQDHLWWNEPLTLFDRIEYPLRLTGESNLIVGSLNDEYGPRRCIEPKDDVYLALIDYIKMVGVLKELSRNHEIYWRLYYRNSSNQEVDVGCIDCGEEDDNITKFVQETLSRYSLDFSTLWDDKLKEAIYSKYFDHNHNPIFEDAKSQDKL